jgi:hypothetical protein
LPNSNLPDSTEDGGGREDKKEQGNAEHDDGEGDREGDERFDNKKIEQRLI